MARCQAGNSDTAFDTSAIDAEERREATLSCPLPNAVRIGIQEWTYRVADGRLHESVESAVAARPHFKFRPTNTDSFMRTDTEHTIYLKDYAASPYRIVSVDLDFLISEVNTRVRALLTIEPRAETEGGTPLVLDGDDLSLGSIAIDGAPLVLSAYEIGRAHV